MALTTEQMLQAMTHPVFPHKVCVWVDYGMYTVVASAVTENDGWHDLTAEHKSASLGAAVKACYDEFTKAREPLV